MGKMVVKDRSSIKKEFQGTVPPMAISQTEFQAFQLGEEVTSNREIKVWMWACCKERNKPSKTK